MHIENGRVEEELLGGVMTNKAKEKQREKDTKEI